MISKGAKALVEHKMIRIVGMILERQKQVEVVRKRLVVTVVHQGQAQVDMTI